MKRNVIYFGFFVILVLVAVCGVSFSHSSQTTTEGVKEKVIPEAYIDKDQPTAIYIEGKSEPVLRIEDLPKEFPPHIQHPEGIGLSSKEFKLASFSPDAQRIAFTTGVVHEWVGVYELESKKVHVITWLWDTSVDQILWSPNSKYFAYRFVPPRGDHVVVITSFKERTAEPYRTNSWHSGVGNPVSIYDLRWSKDSEILQFDIGKYGIRNIEQEQVKTVNLKAIEGEKPKETPKKEKVKKTKYKDQD